MGGALLMVCVLSVAHIKDGHATTFAERSRYLEARDALKQRNLAEFRSLSRSLDNYVLRNYLTYYDLRSRLSTAGAAEVTAFVNANPDMPAAGLLQRRWLRSLGQRRQWQTFRQHYTPSTNASLRCYHLRSLYGTGEREQALDATTAIWLQPVSQPKACDPLFEVWRQTPRFTENVVWQRFEAALRANERSLARYLQRYLSGSRKSAAEAYYDVHVNPSNLLRTRQYKLDTPRYRSLISHGMTRLAARKPKEARKAWPKYKRSHDFDAAVAKRVDSAIAVGLAKKENIFPNRSQRSQITQPDLIEELADVAVEQQNWQQADYWISQLPSDIQNKSQWQYWSARALQNISADHHAQAQTRLGALAKERHYYGFLAARALGLPGEMNAQPGWVTATALARIQRHEGLQRAVELFAVGDNINARREWFQALSQLDRDQQVLAAALAQQLGLTAMMIRTANIAEARDHLHLRFPVVFEPQFRQASLRTAVPTPLLMAIARQESAMEVSARSSADARGLMQLLPSTARIVARRARLPVPDTQDLYDPGTNIALGSYHLAWLIERYNQQTPLAIAAYNAGEHRVDRWIKDADGLPMDVWIEQIPFRETRNYVKNVLAFRYVYGNRLAMPSPIIQVEEMQVSLR